MKVKIIAGTHITHAFEIGSIVKIESVKDGLFLALGVSVYTGNLIEQQLIKEEFKVIPE